MLTDEQQAAVDAAVQAIGDNRLYKIGGYAGTGKTTVAKYIADQIPGCMAGAFTGKAAYRLTQKGLPASTIHKHIYSHAYKDGKALKFELKDDVDGDWFLIDEGSMIPSGLWDDMMSFDKPVLLLGDPGQLEPVGVDPRLMHKSDVVFQKIHRQAAESGIILFATDIRLDEYRQGVGYNDVDIYYSAPCIRDLRWADICICAFNRTRLKFNRRYRQIHNHNGTLCSGERIIVLCNNREYGIFNGQILTINFICNRYPQTTIALCLTDDGIEIKLPLFNPQFGHKPIQNFMRDDVVLADYGYCITCHKAQGSEWDKVMVIDEQCPKLWDTRRWRYTAITRATKELRYFCKTRG